MADNTVLQTISQDDMDVYSKEMLAELNKREKAVRTALNSIDKNMEKVAFSLYWIYSNKAYKAMGYESITDYALEKFDMGKSTTYSFINVVERFAVRNADHIGDKFDDRYKGYSLSKLSILADLSDDEIGGLDISSDMSVRDIKKCLKAREKERYRDALISECEEQVCSDKKGAAGNTDDTVPGQQYTMTIKDNEAVPSTSKPGTGTNADDDKDINSVAGYLIDIVVDGERKTDTQEDSLCGHINASIIENTLRYHPEVDEVIIYRKR